MFALIPFACSEDAENTGPTFSITLRVEGQGTVTSKPAGYACQGPKDCGKKTFTGEFVELGVVPAPGWVLGRQKVDGADVPPANRLIVQGALKVRAITVTFGPPGSTPAGDGGTVTVPTDGGTIVPIDAAPPKPPCGSSVCADGDQCCLYGKGTTYELSCAKSCGSGAEASCTTPGTCAAGQACCLRANGPGGKAALTCEAAAACTGDGAPLCDGQNVCAGSLSCTASGAIAVCTAQK